MQAGCRTGNVLQKRRHFDDLELGQLDDAVRLGALGAEVEVVRARGEKWVVWCGGLRWGKGGMECSLKDSSARECASSGVGGGWGGRGRAVLSTGSCGRV